MIYIDHSATTPVDPRVVEAMLPYFTEKFGNASSLHRFGQDALSALDTAHRTVAEILNAQPKEIVFTGCGSESDNLAVRGVAFALRRRGNHVITTPIEHHAILNTAAQLEKALAKNPEDAVTHANQGWTLLNQRQPLEVRSAKHRFDSDAARPAGSMFLISPYPSQTGQVA